MWELVTLSLPKILTNIIGPFTVGGQVSTKWSKYMETGMFVCFHVTLVYITTKPCFPMYLLHLVLILSPNVHWVSCNCVFTPFSAPNGKRSIESMTVDLVFYVHVPTLVVSPSLPVDGRSLIRTSDLQGMQVCVCMFVCLFDVTKQ